MIAPDRIERSLHAFLTEHIQKRIEIHVVKVVERTGNIAQRNQQIRILEHAVSDKIADDTRPFLRSELGIADRRQHMLFSNGRQRLEGTGRRIRLLQFTGGQNFIMINRVRFQILQFKTMLLFQRDRAIGQTFEKFLFRFLPFLPVTEPDRQRHAIFQRHHRRVAANFKHVRSACHKIRKIGDRNVPAGDTGTGVHHKEIFPFLQRHFVLANIKSVFVNFPAAFRFGCGDLFPVQKQREPVIHAQAKHDLLILFRRDLKRDQRRILDRSISGVQDFQIVNKSAGHEKCFCFSGQLLFQRGCFGILRFQVLIENHSKRSPLQFGGGKGEGHQEK